MRRPRVSIAGLMGVVVLAALGFAAIRLGPEATSGAMTLVTCAVLLLAIVGAVSRQGGRRAWWLGFALFGWAYLVAAYFSSPDGPEFPTIALSSAVASRAGASDGFVADVRGVRAVGGMNGGGGGFGGGGVNTNVPHQWIAHCIWSLLFGLLGALLARLLFGSAPEPGESAVREPVPSGTGTKRWRSWPGMPVTVLSLLVVVTSLALLASTSDMVLWFGATFLLTLAILGLAVLGAVYNRGKRRARWLGAALFGLGYLALVMIGLPDLQVWPDRLTDALLRSAAPLLRVVVRGYPDSIAQNIFATNARIMRALEKHAPFSFNEETPLEDVLKYVKQVANAPDGKGIEIYVDPMGLQEADKTMTSTIRNVELDDVTIKAGLGAILPQLDLAYFVRDGVLVISSEDAVERFPWSASFPSPYSLVSHCFLALIAAGFGALAAGKVWSARPAAEVPPNARAG
jgi:hypothetical protein